ncbi:hypothetical protein TIFTF001_031843 [Ficus carica]|uniref:Uncharacterized protein n=1 Tax=Ficus carica TaxID=3494 RepID=A0AA88J1L8_FICCA|nr:hypothetical protein TIFTF001_031843 [Ficus carica]
MEQSNIVTQWMTTGHQPESMSELLSLSVPRLPDSSQWIIIGHPRESVIEIDRRSPPVTIDAANLTYLLDDMI